MASLPLFDEPALYNFMVGGILATMVLCGIGMAMDWWKKRR